MPKTINMRCAFVAVLVLIAACAPELVTPGNTVSGEIRFARDVTLPDDATIIVTLWDSSWSESSKEISRQIINNATQLPVMFEIIYDPGMISEYGEYTLDATIKRDDTLLYYTDTVHPVLTRGNSQNSDIAVVSSNPIDTCTTPLVGRLHSEAGGEALPPEAKLYVVLTDTTEPREKFVVTEATFIN